MPQRQIPPERKAIFYIGMVVAVIGFLCFISVFFSAALNFGDFSNFKQRGRSMGMRAVVGMVMMIGGSILARVWAYGLGWLWRPTRPRGDTPRC